MIDTIENAAAQDPTLEVTVTGDDLLPATISREITRTQVLGTSITIATALLLLAGYFAWTHCRPMIGVIATLPVAGVLALVLAFMRFAGVVYNPLTALLTSLTIGLGVDYTIHFTHRYLHELPQSTAATAIRDAASTTGVALVGSALTTFVGFAILSLAPVSVISELGTLTAATIAATMIATATTLPALLCLSSPKGRRPQQKRNHTMNPHIPPGTWTLDPSAAQVAIQVKNWVFKTVDAPPSTRRRGCNCPSFMIGNQLSVSVKGVARRDAD